jgi:hypothetical protein
MRSIVHCNILGVAYVWGVCWSHPPDPPAADEIHLLPCLIYNRARCTSSRSGPFSPIKFRFFVAFAAPICCFPIDRRRSLTSYQSRYDWSGERTRRQRRASVALKFMAVVLAIAAFASIGFFSFLGALAKTPFF